MGKKTIGLSPVNVFNTMISERTIVSCVFVLQRIVRMNKTEDDEMDIAELTEDELRQVAGKPLLCSLTHSLRLFFI